MSKVRFATIGTSSITELFLKAAAGVPEFELAGVYSRNIENAREFGSSYGARRFYDSLDVLAEDPEIDAVYVASPNGLHHSQAIRMMKGGKHVLCEKAMASNLREVREMAAAADQAGVVLLEAVRSLHDPGFQMIRDNLEKLGTIRQVSFSFGKYSSKYDAFKAGEPCNIFAAKMAAGGLMDIGIYCVEPLTALFGRPDEIRAAAVLLRGGIDGAGTVLARYEGMTAELTYSKIADLYGKSWIAGEEATMLIPAITAPREIEMIYRDGRHETLAVAGEDNNMIYELKYFIRALREGLDVSGYREISLLSMEIMDRARQEMGVVFAAD